MTNNPDSLDYDDMLPPPNEYKRLPEGDAAFEVLATKRGSRMMGSLGETRIIELTLSVTPCDGSGTQKLVTELKLHTKLAFLFYQFAASIGQYEHGSKDAIKIDWDRVPGSCGFCVIKHRQYKNKEGEDRVAVDVEAWLDAQGRASAKDKPRELSHPEIGF